MNKLTIAKTKIIQGYKWIVAPKSEFCENHFFFDLLPACEKLCEYHEGTAEVLTVGEWVEENE